MKNINEKYAHLQRTSWPQYANTTLGHLPADKYKQIEAAYEAQIAQETAQETPTGNPPTPDVEMPVGDSMNSTGSGQELTPQAGVDIPSPTDVQANADVGTNNDATESVASEMADTETGFDDEIKAGE